MGRFLAPRAFSAAFGRLVRQKREALGLSQGALARRAGMLQPNVSQLEAGRRGPSVWTLSRLAQALGCEPAELIPTDDRPTG